MDGRRGDGVEAYGRLRVGGRVWERLGGRAGVVPFGFSESWVGPDIEPDAPEILASDE